MLILMMMGGAGMMRVVDRVDVQLIGHAVGFLQSVIGLHRRRWLHSREMRERLQSALISGTIAGLLDLTVWRREIVIVVRTVARGRRAADGPHRWRTAASRGSRASADLMQIRLLGQYVFEMVRMMVMIAAPVAGCSARRSEIREEYA